MQSTSWELPGWMNPSGMKIAERNTNNLRYVEDSTLMAESEEKKKQNPKLLRVKEESEKADLKLHI